MSGDVAGGETTAAVRPIAGRPPRAADGLDQVLRTTTPRGWWALGALLAILVAAGLWSALAWVPLQLTFTATVAAGSASGTDLTTYLPASHLPDLPVGSAVDVTLTDPPTGRTATVTGTVSSVGSAPADPATMLDASSSPAQVDAWLDAAGGTAYPVGITVDAAEVTGIGFAPQAGQPATVLRTYAQVHPIDIVLGGR